MHVIEHLDEHNDEAAVATLKARLQGARIGDADLVSAELSAYRIQAADRNFGSIVTMNLLGELTDIELPALYTDHYEDAWDKAAQSIGAATAALQTRARMLSAKAFSLSTARIGAPDV